MLLEERGQLALGLREIARRVGVSAPFACHHFPSLDAIAVGLAEQGRRRWRNAWRSLHAATRAGSKVSARRTSGSPAPTPHATA
ncbi:MAG: TetR family transcriptional regulator [Hyphomicrobiaceae bacterium]|nr:TetR family transcriptional regulator [Hyphomicrobiaceae bacterium]